jgi:hypothetical protein
MDDPRMIPLTAPAGAPPSAEPQAPLPSEASAAAVEDQETDVWWGGYAGRTMLPSFVGCVLITAVIGVGAFFFWWIEGSPPLLVRYSAYVLAGGVWLFQLGRWTYRVVTLTYRLTTRRLAVERMLSRSPWCGVNLRQVRMVLVQRRPWERWLKVGRLLVYAETEPLPLLILDGVYEPEHVAVQVRLLAQQARERQKGVPPAS